LINEVKPQAVVVEDLLFLEEDDLLLPEEEDLLLLEEEH